MTTHSPFCGSHDNIGCTCGHLENTMPTPGTKAVYDTFLNALQLLMSKHDDGELSADERIEELRNHIQDAGFGQELDELAGWLND
jgi:hypothetical protein